MTAPSGPLAAVRLPLDPGPPLDPFALAGGSGALLHDGDRVLVGIGTARTLPLLAGLADGGRLRALGEELAAIPCTDRLPAGARADAPAPVLALGALPFDRDEPASLLVPELLYGADADGHEWVTVVADDPGSLPDAPDGLRARLAARSAGDADTGVGVTRPVVRPCSSDAEFEASVATAVASVGRGELVKVVLARQVDVDLDRAVDVAALLRRWHGLEPACTVFSLPAAGGRFVGASPELLVERRGARVVSRPLAGTSGRPGDVAAPHHDLLGSSKDGLEHRLVVEAIASALAPACDALEVPARPDLVHLHSMSHLGTAITGSLRAGADGRRPGALELVGALHPTPAVGGVPTDAARRAIARLEPLVRAAYAGPVGYVDAAGDGTWVLGIRSMTLDGLRARLAAGVGVVAGSDPGEERREADLKLRAVFAALAPDAAFSTAASPGTAGRRAAVG